MSKPFRLDTIACMDFVINAIHERLPLVDVSAIVAKYKENGQPIDEGHYREMVAIRDLSQEWMEKVSDLLLHHGTSEELSDAQEVVRALKAIWSTIH